MRQLKLYGKNPIYCPPVQGRFGVPSTPHVGISYPAAFIADRGHVPHVLDLRVEKLSLADIRERVEFLAPNFIGITSVSIEYH